MQENNNNYTHDDEINLGELFIKLWDQKWMIVIPTIVCVCMALAFAMTRPSVYQVKAVLTPPENDQLLDINLNGLKKYSPEAVFKLYFKELNSPASLREYYQLTKWYESESDASDTPLSQSEIDSRFLSFLNEMKVSNSTPNFLQKTSGGKIVTGSDANLLQADIAWNTSNSEKTAEFINGYLVFANKQLVGKIHKEQSASKEQQLSELTRIQDLALSVEKQQRELTIIKLRENQKVGVSKVEDEIERLVDAHFENLESQLVQLKESLAIAEKLNIVEPKSLEDFYADSQNLGQIEIYTTDKSDRSKDYLLGSKFLKAEIQEIEKRRKDTRFVEGLSGLKQKLASAKKDRELESLQSRTDDKPYVEAYLATLDKVVQLSNYNLEFNNPDFYQVIQPALAPGQAVGRSKVIYLALGVVIGGILGLLMALINIAITNYREKNKTNA